MCTIIVLIILATIYSEISIGEKEFELNTADIIPQTTKNI